MLNKTPIEFCDYTLNQVTGCRNGCTYCWAEKLWNRFYRNTGSFDTPRLYPDRFFDKPIKLPKQRNDIVQLISPDKPVVFMVDMGDIFSPGVQNEWKHKIFLWCRDHPEANFLFLTKRPDEYPTWIGVIPENTILGTSLDFAHHMDRIAPLRVMKQAGYRTFVNIEPILSFMWAVNFTGVDFVTVGAIDSGKPPLKAWVKSIQHPVVYYKRNIINHFPEFKNQ